ncbi:hypothetical protein LINGRAHAP2_LOCUS30280, partial [Linum grandiflorum]
NPLDSLIEETLDDIYDESLIPILIRTSDCPLRLGFNLENEIEGYSKSRVEAIRLSDGEKAVNSYVIPLNISDLLAQRLKDAADTLAQ